MMQKITKKSISLCNSIILGTKFNPKLKPRSTMRSEQSKLIDLIRLNQPILLDCPRSEKIG